jgi:sec-independent protein translocase protein TatB
MLGVGWLEMLVIGVVALIVIGPKDLPVVMHRIGKFAGTIRRMGADFQRELNKTTGLDEVRNLRSSIVQPLKATTDAIRKEFNSITPTGQVQPSGVIKPADPKVESVVSELHAAAGMKPAEAIGTAAAAAPAIAAKAPVKAARVSKPSAAPVETPPAPKAVPKKLAAKKAIESPAPIEAVAPVKKKAPAKKLAAEPMPAMPAPKPAAKAASKPVAVVAEKAPPKRKPAAKKA